MEVKVVKQEDFDAILTDIHQSIKERPNPTPTAIEDLKAAGFATLEDIRGMLGTMGPKPAPAPTVEEAVEAVLEESGVLSGVMRTKFMGIPIVEAAGGGFVAIVGSELIDGLMANSSLMTKGIVKLVTAGATAKWGKKLLGNTGATVVALLLTFDAVRDLTPLDSWANQIANRVSGIVPSGGLGAQRGGGVVNQANRVARDYYARSEGRT